MATNPTLLTMPIAENGQKNTIPATQAAAGDGLLSQSTGFPPETALPLGAGGKAPTREDFNGAFNLLSDIAFYSQKGWTFQYDENQAYYKGCIVMDATDGLRYECINDVDAGEILPSADTNNDYWREYSPGGVPLGTILPYAANAAEPPYSFLFCEGQAVSRTMYPDLFALIGTTYGAGDGSTTFNLPKPLGKYPQFAQTAGTVKAAGLPNITGDALFNRNSLGAPMTGAFGYSIESASGSYTNLSSDTNKFHLTFNASKSNPIYGASDTVTPSTITFRAIIKAYDAPTPSSAQIDLSQYASDLAARLTREQTPAFNKRDVITTSGTYTAPVTGWYKITVKGGGGGGAAGASGGGILPAAYNGGVGGGEGGMSVGYEKMTAGQTASVVVGAGGAGGTSDGANGGSGGNTATTVNGNTYTGYGGSSYTGGSGNYAYGANGIIGGKGYVPAGTNTSPSFLGGAGGGNGGAARFGTAHDGGGGYGGDGTNNGFTAGSNGAAGFVWFEYFDPTLM